MQHKLSHPQNIFENKNGGFIALMSAIVISVLLLAITLGLGFSSFFSRFNIFDSESKARSLALAEACANIAILKLAGDKDYLLTAGDSAIAVHGSDTCSIISISPTLRTFPITMQTRAIVNKASTSLEVIIASDYQVISWQELPQF